MNLDDLDPSSALAALVELYWTISGGSIDAAIDKTEELIKKIKSSPLKDRAKWPTHIRLKSGDLITVDEYIARTLMEEVGQFREQWSNRN